MTLYPDNVTITQVIYTNEGLELYATLKDAVNTVWENCDELTAITDKKARSASPAHLGTPTAHQLPTVM